MMSIDIDATRRSRQREAILRVLKGTTAHPNADWVYDEVRKEVPNISKGTVYRNLRFLQEKGEISALNPDGTVTRYEGRTDNHHHFACQACVGLFDLEVPVIREFDQHLAQLTGFKVSHHKLYFFGLCLDCQKQTAK